jgi:hypothetical protein
MTAIVPAVPPRTGGNHPVHGVFLGGGAVDDTWVMPTSRNRFSTQRRDVRYIAKIERGLTDARDSASSPKFNGQMDVTSGDTAELDKDRFVREIDQSVREHGHQFFFAVEQGGIVRDLIKDHHLFSVEDIVLAMKLRMDPTTLGPERLDPYERDDIDLSRTLVETKLSPTMRERIRVQYDHLDDFFDLPGSVIFMMSLEICNASQSFDIEGALENLERLTLDDYPGEDVTECGAIAQKYVKIMQGGYALPVKTGSEILYKFTKTSCE